MTSSESASSLVATQRAFIEWVIKAIEILVQSRTRQFSNGTSRPSRHFALVSPERLDTRSKLALIERDFFTGKLRINLHISDSVSGTVLEKYVFQFLGLDDLPPPVRFTSIGSSISTDDKKNVSLLRRLSVAIRSVFCISRLLPCFTEFFLFRKQDLGYSLNFADEDSQGIFLSSSSFVSQEICNISSPSGALKLLVSYCRSFAGLNLISLASTPPISPKSNLLPGTPPISFKPEINEGFISPCKVTEEEREGERKIENNNFQMVLVEEQVNPRKVSLVFPPKPTNFQTHFIDFSDSSSQKSTLNGSPMSAVRDALADIWPKPSLYSLSTSSLLSKPNISNSNLLIPLRYTIESSSLCDRELPGRRIFSKESILNWKENSRLGIERTNNEEVIFKTFSQAIFEIDEVSYLQLFNENGKKRISEIIQDFRHFEKIERFMRKMEDMEIS